MASFDVVSKLDHHEVDNAVNQAKREVGQRYDFKGTDTSVEKNEGPGSRSPRTAKVGAPPRSACSRRR